MIAHNIIVQNDGNGTASASLVSSKAGTEINLSAIANRDYHFKEWQVISGDVTISNDRFTMPAANVTVKAVFEKDDAPIPSKPAEYSVTIQSDGGGTASASPISATAGTEIILTAAPDSGYHFKTWQVISGGVTIDGGGFTMPAANVTVKAVFEKDEEPIPPQPAEYSVTVQSDGGGTASASPISATAGTEITLTAAPDSGYHFKAWQVISGGVAINGSGFTMPAANVTVKAIFEQDNTPPQPEPETKLEITNGISEVPLGFKGLEHLDTPEEIVQAMRTAITQTGVPPENTAVYDVTLMTSIDGGATWTPATKENFSSEGLTITLPYPEGTNSRYRFTAAHMFTTSDFGKTPGNIETPAVTNTDGGIRFTITGLSPISVGWVQPGTPTTPSGPSSGSGGNINTYAVIIEKSEQGNVTANKTHAGSGSTVNLTITPDNGYGLDTLTVTGSRGGKVKLTEEGDGKYSFTMPSGAVTVKAIFAPLPDGGKNVCGGGADCPAHQFTDLGGVGAWYHEAVDFVLRNGLMNGFSDTLFGPDERLSRAQLAQILYNKEGKPSVSDNGVFTDVDGGAWYAPAIIWAAGSGIVGGYGDGRFGPDDNITREQLAVMLWRYAGNPVATGKELHFSDAAFIDGWALEALRWAVDNGILNGKGGGILDPRGLTTRAEAAQMLKNLLA